jgi:hypothetical protein
MKEKKNIDELFKKGFKNFEAKPSPRVWENIQAELKKEKKERKVIPLWVKIGSVAALLALLFTVGNSVFNTSDSTIPSLTNEDAVRSGTEIQENNTRSSVIDEKSNETKVEVASEDKTFQDNKSNTQNTSEGSSDKMKNQILSPEKKTNRTTIAVEDSKRISSDKKTERNAVAVQNSEKNSSKKEKTAKEDLIKKNTSENNVTKESIASNVSSETKKEKSNTLNENEKTFIKKEEGITQTDKHGAEGIVAAENSKEKIDKTEKEKEATKTDKATNKKSILDAIAEQNKKEAPKPKKQKPENRWEVAPNVAPVYYSSLGNGSSIDPSFSDNSQKGDVNMSYGVQVGYALNKRLSIRTGVNNVDLSYATSGIEIGTGPVAVALNSVDYGGKQIVVTAVDKGAFAQSNPSNGFGDITPKSTQGDARIIQNINYYEVPLELKYAVIDSRFGVNVIGGVSTLFLGNNEISVKADNFNSVLGEANNLSSVSFSTNVGLGLDYRLSKKFTFNIEPMFKYQLNPYTDSSVNFKPYYLGVYSGLSFKF